MRHNRNRPVDSRYYGQLKAFGVTEYDGQSLIVQQDA